MWNSRLLTAWDDFGRPVLVSPPGLLRAQVSQPLTQQAHQFGVAVLNEILSISNVVESVGVSRSTLWRMVRTGRFPQPLTISVRRRGWCRTDVEAWLEARRAEAYGPQARAAPIAAEGTSR